MAERPPPRIRIQGLANLLRWYERNLCETELIDRRGHRVKFAPERFPYLIKLRNREGGKLSNPKWHVERIRAGELTDRDFGGFEAERAETLSWLPPMILRHTLIARNSHRVIPGDELYVKEFDKLGSRHKVLICIRVSTNLLVPVTSFLRSSVRFGPEEILWPEK